MIADLATVPTGSTVPTSSERSAADSNGHRADFGPAIDEARNSLRPSDDTVRDRSTDQTAQRSRPRSSASRRTTNTDDANDQTLRGDHRDEPADEAPTPLLGRNDIGTTRPGSSEEGLLGEATLPSAPRAELATAAASELVDGLEPVLARPPHTPAQQETQPAPEGDGVHLGQFQLMSAEGSRPGQLPSDSFPSNQLAAESHPPSRRPDSAHDTTGSEAGQLLAAQGGQDHRGGSLAEADPAAVKVEDGQHHADPTSESSQAPVTPASQSKQAGVGHDAGSEGLVGSSSSLPSDSQTAARQSPPDSSPAITSLVDNSTLSGDQKAAEPTAAEAPTRTTALEPEVESALWEQVQRALSRARATADGQDVRLRLTPADLGELLVRVNTVGDQVSVRLVVNSVAAHQTLLEERSRLSGELIAAGFEGGSVDVSQDGGTSDEPYQQAPWRRPDHTSDPVPWERTQRGTERRAPIGRRASSDRVVDLAL